MGQLRVENLSFGYGARAVLSDLSLEFPKGQLIGIVGPNGCGKSTLISLLGNLAKPQAGRVTLDGKCLTQHGRRELAQRLAFLPQNPVCPPGITVEQVLGYGRHPHQTLWRQFSAADAAMIGEIRDRLHLGPHMSALMDQLSGGQRQKAWLAMALVQDTDIVLLDEPTSALDVGHQIEVLECIRAARQMGKTVIMVIHELLMAARYCDVLVAMKGGRVAKFGPPRQVLDQDLILDLYGVTASILTAPGDGCPVVVPQRFTPEDIGRCKGEL